MGDFNGDGIVDDKDATLLSANWGAGSAGGNASVPEPGSLILLIGLVGLVELGRSAKAAQR